MVERLTNIQLEPRSYMLLRNRKFAYYPRSIQQKVSLLIIPIFAIVMAVFWTLTFQLGGLVEAAPPVCSDSDWIVADQSELDAAISCFNSKTTAGSYTITLTQNISLITSTLTISNTEIGTNLFVEGNGYIVDGQNITGTRPFDIDTDTHVTIQNITITRGKTEFNVGTDFNQSGGAIRNSGVLTVSHSVISGNWALRGGAIFVRNGALTVDSSMLKGNLAGSGGGIANRDGTITLMNSVVFSNTARFGSGIESIRGTVSVADSTFMDNLAIFGDGAAVYNFDSLLTIEKSLFNGNVAEGNGGAIVNDDGTVVVTDSTFSGNSAGFSGGSIYNDDTLTVTHSTFSGNSADMDGGAIYTTRGFHNTDGKMTVSNSILANSLSGGDCTIYDNGGAITVTVNDGGNNIVEDNSCGFTGGSDPLLAPLQDNGGPTWTHALLLGSPAIDAGNSSEPTDQRGIVRPQGNHPDIGAFEAISYLIKVTNIGNGSGIVTSLQAALNCGMTCTSSIIESNVVTLTATADLGSNFSGWTGDIVTTTNPLPVTVDQAKSVTATFTLNQYPLTIATDGTGSGSIGKTPDAALYDYGTVVSLTATADLGSTFIGWTDDIVTITNPLPLTIDGAKNIVANFMLNQYPLTTTTDGTGSGSVSKTPDLSSYDFGTMVILTATADVGSTFTGWSGDASGTTNPLAVTVDEGKNITATFTLGTNVLVVVKDGTGSGGVSSDPAGIDCGATCALNFDYGTVVTLTATAESGSLFSGWSGGGCTGTGSCTVTLNETQNVTATFTLLQIFLPLITVPPVPTYPDLVVDSVTVSEDAAVEIIIRNSGRAPVAAEFWVDLYIGLKDPNVVPSKVNDIWQDFSPHGGAWLVTTNRLPLAPGETLTLRVGDSYFDATVSDIGASIAADVSLYVQVDAADAENPSTGSVLENHEQSGTASNNLFGPVFR